MEALIAQVIDWVKTNPSWSLTAVFLISVSESLAVIGLIVPGVVMMGAMGALIAAGAIGFWPVVVAAVLGAIVGDGLSFWLGHALRDDVRRYWPFSRYPETLNFGVRFFDTYGSLSIIFGRFVGPVRPVIPVVAGMMGMSPTRFTLANVVSAVLWAPAYIVPGILVAASVKLAAETTIRLAIVLIGLLGAIWLTAWLVGWSFRLISPHASAWVQGLLRWGELHPKVGEVARALADPSHPETRALTALSGLLTLGVAVFGLATGVTVLGAGELRINRAALDLAQSLSSPFADGLMLTLSRLGDLWVILALVLMLYGHERLRRAGRQANYWLAAGGFALITPPLLQVLLRVPRPELGLAPETGLLLDTLLSPLTPWAFPSGHVLRATVVFGFLAVVLAGTLAPAWRSLPYILSAALVTAVAVARVFLGVEWLTGVLATVALGLTWVAALGLAFRRHTAGGPRPGTLAAMAAATLAAGVWVQTWLHHDAEVAALRPPPASVVSNREDWRSDLWQRISRRREDIWQRAAQPMDIQYLGTLQDLAAALGAQGWEPARPLGWSTALSLFSPELPLQDLPVPPQVHAGRHEAAALVKRLPDGGRLVLRLWSTRYQIDAMPLWVGNVTAQRKDILLNLFVIPATVQEFAGPRSELKRDLAAAPGVTCTPRPGVLLIALGPDRHPSP